MPIPPLSELNRKKLRDARKAAGLTQAELGSRVGVTSQAVTMYESGQRAPSLETLEAVCKALRLSVTVKTTTVVTIKSKK